MNDPKNRKLKIILAVLALGMGLVHLPRFFPVVGVWVLVVSGNAPDCSLMAGLRATYRRLLYEPAAARVLLARVQRRIDGELVLTGTPQGDYWEPRRTNSMVIAQVAELETKYAAGARRPVNPGDVVIDCGANVGVFTREAVRLGAKLVVAVEPDPIHLECLRRNLSGEIARGQVVLVPKGVWDQPGQLMLRQHKDTTARNSFLPLADSADGPVLPLTTIDVLVEELSLGVVNFIKMDIEGSEPKALRGARKTLARWHPRMELEVSVEPGELVGIARESWAGYQPECLVCITQPERHRIVPSLLVLQ